ncbi:helix-turn-helix domain-containing protein [Mycobacteroides abscessus]|uniref:helix-turn-helix domain-containing protein n=1 Tax=Mycobacteroides abscessus TaxID=36809 RepID=UPI000929BB8F|nr:helix-turn-helix transcriptional regulator [Mycobacteroides abscessus]MDO3200606.1 helix-turn-helix transcriptional regulator [Mycobacteroides abscessus subsp. abscessus]SHY19962.1 transciptional regulatory protein [Mycobacteroides abscessus subsp. abscessus]SHY61037.1 transciptional regulatory protein [Mycobacteroides abscessus subsp. abscessus]SIK85080.1 transciptional regulatory protein [Mycobacteroides abscessus subsp. abscessus]SLC91114.1 transciptional regulatory protein [Mycobacteroi
MYDLEDIEQAAGLDPHSLEYQLATRLAEADDELLEQLVLMRKSKNLTQEDVAKRMNRHKAAVSNFERLSTDPHLSTIRRYAAAIGAAITHEVHDFEVELAYESATELVEELQRIATELTAEIDISWADEGVLADVITLETYRSGKSVKSLARSNLSSICCDG